eukprot:scaffold5918_cov124-Isochrysis_galbana.AAC.7
MVRCLRAHPQKQLSLRRAAHGPEARRASFQVPEMRTQHVRPTRRTGLDTHWVVRCLIHTFIFEEGPGLLRRRCASYISGLFSRLSLPKRPRACDAGHLHRECGSAVVRRVHASGHAARAHAQSGAGSKRSRLPFPQTTLPTLINSQFNPCAPADTMHYGLLLYTTYYFCC